MKKSEKKILDNDYDAFVEHCVGLSDGGQYDSVAVPTNQEDCIHEVLKLDSLDAEGQLQDLCEIVIEESICEEGFAQELGDICKRSEVRSYKLNRRGM